MSRTTTPYSYSYKCWILSLLVAAVGMSLSRGFFASILSKQSILFYRSATTTTTSRATMTKDAKANANANVISMEPYTFPVPPETSQLEAPLHLVVLVHGWLGNPTELAVLQQALETEALNLRNNEKKNQQPLLLVHSATCNDGRTTDGIAAGARRLASEINHWIAALSSQLPPQTLAQYPITLSLVGNSLGGLYARYALSEINWNNNNNVVPAVFVTTVTPHLGVAAPHTYLTLPKAAEYGVATVLKETGRDLFRVTPTIQQMTVDAQFVRPLQQFRRRIALANAHNTDFQVPCSTAAFLSKTATAVSNHRRIDDDNKPLLPHAVLAVETTTTSGVGDDDNDKDTCTTQDQGGNNNNNNNNKQQQLSSDELAERLDALGWTKIFCDVRSHLPSFNPLASALARSSSQEEEEETDGKNDNQDDTYNNYNNKEYYTSSELWKAFASFLPPDGRLHVPFGHQVLVANAKNAKYAAWTQGGRVVMRELAQTLVRDIVATTTMPGTATAATTNNERSGSSSSSGKETEETKTVASSIPGPDIKK